VNGERPSGYNTLELPAIFVPDGNPDNISAADIVSTVGPRAAVMFRAIFVSDGSELAPPGYQCVEFGRMALPGQPTAKRANGNRRVPGSGAASAGATWSVAGRTTAVAGRATNTASVPGQPPAASPTAGAEYDGSAAAMAWLADYRYPDIGATMKAWNALSDPRATMAALEAVSGRNPVVGEDTDPTGNLHAYVNNDPFNNVDPSRLIGYGLGSVNAGLQGKLRGGSGSITQVQAVIVAPPPQSVAGGPADDPSLTAARYLTAGRKAVSQAISSAIANILNNQNQGDRPEIPVDPGFTEPALEKMNTRGISPADVKSALSGPKNVATGENGNTVVTGKNGVTVIVDRVTNEVISVFRPGAR